jgi:hypothetical protein
VVTSLSGNGHGGQGEEKSEHRCDKEGLAAIHRAEPSFPERYVEGFVAKASIPLGLDAMTTTAMTAGC